MQTVANNLEASAEKIKDLLEVLLLRHSTIYLWNTPSNEVLVLSGTGDYAYKELDNKGRQVQSHLLKEYSRFFDLLTVLLKNQPQDTNRELSEADAIIRHTIDQQHTWCKTPADAFGKAVEALYKQIGLLARLYDDSSGDVVYVPDTNALIYNPDIERWKFSDSTKFTLVFLPTVLAELDELKINHRNENVRKKAEKLIRKIKEYRRRGQLISGVDIVKNKIRLQAVAVEPDMSSSLPWLDKTNNDDRLLAGVIELMRSIPHSPVIAVSGDINFQNKAEFANIPYDEPPEI